MNIEPAMPPPSHIIITAILWLVFIFSDIVFLFPNPARAEQSDQFKAAIVVSRHIKPYMDALKGLRESLSETGNIAQQIYMLEQHDLEHPDTLVREISGRDFDIILSIGPEATSLAWSISEDADMPAVYAMVLNPDALAADGEKTGCGVSLNIPVVRQLHDIRKALPGVNRLGVLFDPDENQSFIQQAMAASLFSSIEIIPLRVSSSTQVPDVLEENWGRIDSLWLIPDQTVISQTMVEYIVKEALFQKKPVVGYNRFFFDSGAAVAFALDFEDIGRQTAEMALNKLHGLPCGQTVPSYQVLINHKVLRSMGMSVSGMEQ